MKRKASARTSSRAHATTVIGKKQKDNMIANSATYSPTQAPALAIINMMTIGAQYGAEHQKDESSLHQNTLR